MRRGIQRAANDLWGDAVGLRLPRGIEAWTARGLDLLRNTRNQLRYGAKQIGSAESDHAIGVATAFWPAHARHWRRGTATGCSEQVVVPAHPERQGSGARDAVHPGVFAGRLPGEWARRHRRVSSVGKDGPMSAPTSHATPTKYQTGRSAHRVCRRHPCQPVDRVDEPRQRRLSIRRQNALTGLG